MNKGDKCFFYHSNIWKEIVGIVEVIKELKSKVLQNEIKNYLKPKPWDIDVSEMELEMKRRNVMDALTLSKGEEKWNKTLTAEVKKERRKINYMERTIENELNINTFFRLKEPSIINSIIDKGEELKDNSPKEVFLALRRLRNNW